MSIVIVGHVDHGKSTIVGRLLADTGSLPEGKLEAVRAQCERTARPFEYAFLLDALEDEQAQGITIDAARVFFRTAARRYLLVDAPGHIEFLRNMVTGAARAEAAVLVVAANEGVRENSRRHGYMLSLLGIRKVVVAVNKMDLVGWSKATFDAVTDELAAFLARAGLRPQGFIPVSGREGATISHRSTHLAWYDGPTVLEALDRFEPEAAPVEKAFRMPVQDVYRFTAAGDDRRIFAGSVESGALAPGDEVVFYPSGKKSRVHAIEAFNRPPPARTEAGEATGFTLAEQIYVTRGEVAARAGEPPPHVTTRFRASVFWLGREPLARNRDYAFKLGAAKIPARVEAFHTVVDASSLAAIEKDRADRNDVAECTLKLERAAAFDLAADNAGLGRFVLIDGYEIAGGGVIREALPDRAQWVRDKVLLRNYKWEPSAIAPERRAERLGQRPLAVVFTGGSPAQRKGLARGLETRLFDAGRLAYFLGIGNVLYGIDADIERTPDNRAEHLRRLAEVTNILLDAGLIAVVTAADLAEADMDILRASIEDGSLVTVWVGDRVTTDLGFDVRVADGEADDEAVDRLVARLKERGAIFRWW